AYALNPDVSRWANVPWRVEPRLVDLTIGWVCAPPAPATEEPAVARYSAQLGPVVARYSAPQNPGVARSERAKSSHLLARYSAPQTESSPRGTPFTGSSYEVPPPHHQEEEERQREEPEGTGRVVEVIAHRTGRPLGGRF